MYSLDEINEMSPREEIVARQYRSLVGQLFDKHKPKCPTCDCLLDIEWNDEPYWHCCLCSENHSGSGSGLERLITFGKCCSGLKVIRFNSKDGHRFVGCSRYSQGCDYAQPFSVYEMSVERCIRKEWKALKDKAVAESSSL